MSNLIALYNTTSTIATPIAPLYNYSIESLTRDVYVKPLHSHNDYWRQTPFFDALSVGCQSIESDIWYFPQDYELDRGNQTLYFHNDDIYVGHNQVYLQPSNSLNNLYLDPLFDFLSFANPTFSYSNNSPGNPLLEDFGASHSIFWNSPETPLLFWMDIKTDADETYDAVKPLFQRFIDNNFLAYYDTENNKFVPGPVIVTITGNLPRGKVELESKRYFFLDAPLSLFVNATDDQEIANWKSLSVVASGSLESVLGIDYLDSKFNSFNDEQKSKIKTTFDNAHKYGLKTRIWGDITWPNSIMYSHLRDFYSLGSDLLNVDDLKSASQLI